MWDLIKLAGVCAVAGFGWAFGARIEQKVAGFVGDQMSNANSVSNKMLADIKATYEKLMGHAPSDADVAKIAAEALKLQTASAA